VIVDGAAAGPPMVLLHGLGEDAGSWAPVQPGLARRHRVYAPDLRGHGRGPHPGSYSFELMRDDVLGFLDATGIDRCVLVGHSMGAIVAMLVAQAAGHRLTHLILEDATPPRPGELDRPPLDPPEAPTPYDFAVVNAIRAQLHDPDPAWWAATASVEVPTLIIGGAQSPIPAAMLTATAQRMPDATVVTLAAGHDVHREQPAAFLAAVEAFLTREGAKGSAAPR
jgi:pimeloyl-ACP methyl ester carboxylesterase